MEDLTPLVIDLETSVKCPVGNNKAHPMWRGNKIVAVGSLAETAYVAEYETDGVNTNSFVTNADAYYFIGHNIKFDLLYLWRNHPNTPLPMLWDTQLAEYILTGQQAKYSSLDELTNKYVGTHTLKDTEIKEHWKNGGHTETIERGKLLKYLRNDVENTHTIFEAQWAAAEFNGQLDLIFTQMDALRATTAMNLAGMEIDWVYVDKQRKEYGEQIDKLEAELGAVDYKSNKQLSLYFFGGEEKYTEREDAGFYKNGRPKTLLVNKVREVKGFYNAKEFGLTVGKNGYYSVDDSSLSMLGQSGDATAQTIQQLRTLQKIKETYYEGLNSLRFPDGRIYPQLNHCSTATARLSCTAPNLQNQTEVGDVKRAFVSRFGDRGSILELDYSQLEMVWLGYLANDQQLVDDINAGRDMHKELYKEMYGRYPTDKERKPFKRFSFLLVYGGGANTLVQQSGCDLPTAKKFIKTFYNRYKGVKDYHTSIVAKANKERELYYTEDSSGVKYEYIHKMPWGRRYRFGSYLSEFTREESFSPTELKNYMIQGSATGDMVPLLVGILQRKLEERGYYQHGTAKLVMTVHDSVVLDVHDDVLYNVASLAKEVMEDAPRYLKTYFNIDFPCKLSCGVEAGKNWQDKTDIKGTL